MQLALIIFNGGQGLDELNVYLKDGWKVISNAPMGGGGNSISFYSLVIIEKEFKV